MSKHPSEIKFTVDKKGPMMDAYKCMECNPVDEEPCVLFGVSGAIAPKSCPYDAFEPEWKKLVRG